MVKRRCQLIGASLGWGAQDHFCEEGPQAIKRAWDQIMTSDWENVSPHTHSESHLAPSDCLKEIIQCDQQLAEKVSGALDHELFPIVLGGDHSIAIGTWNGVAIHQKGEPFGLIWLDAHMDAHTPATTPTGAIHGMPFAALLGYGEDKLVHIKKNTPVIQPEHVCLIGVRSYEKGEAELLKRLGVRVFMMDEVLTKGLKNVITEAMQHVCKGTKRFGVSLDLDVIDPEDAPGVGSPAAHGIDKDVLLNSLLLLSDDPRLIAFEMVEYNPRHDIQGKTLRICLDVLRMLTHPLLSWMK